MVSGKREAGSGKLRAGTWKLMKRIAILGSTGSIGQSALAVVDAHPKRLRVVASPRAGTRRGSPSRSSGIARRARRWPPNRVRRG